MKKFVTTLFIILGILSSVAASAANEGITSKGIVFILAQKHDLTSYQQKLALVLIDSAKQLKKEFNNPQNDMKAFMATLVTEENVDVAKLMAKYKEWQAKVDFQLEQVLTKFASLHHNLSVEQRQQIFESLKNVHKISNDE